MEGHLRPRALITGASSGIGAAFADRLARDGWDLVLIGRRRERLESVATQCRRARESRVEVIVADLARSPELKAIEQRLRNDPPVDMLVNNAGYGEFKRLVEIDPDRAEELLQVQVVAVTRLTRAVLPGMICRRSGTIINVSSRLALSSSLPSPPLPDRTVYAAGKAYINSFTQLLHAEVSGTGVRVQALCPGLVRTEFFERMGVDPVSFPETMMMEPEDVVSASLAGLRLDEVICMPGLSDYSFLAGVDDAQRRVFEHSHSASLAERYQR